MSLFKKEITLYAAADGEIKELSEAKDPVFAEKILGEGYLQLLENDLVTAPADGVVSSIADTRHAYTLSLENGFSVLVHIGIDSVSLNGEGLTPLVKTGERVRTGTPLCRVDRSLFKERGIPDCVPVIVPESDRLGRCAVFKGPSKAGGTKAFTARTGG